jgi:hypothetical protein
MTDLASVFTLTRGDRAATDRTGHGCIMNVVAFLQGDQDTDHPQGMDEAIRTLCIFVNDCASDLDRQRLLLPLAPRLVQCGYACMALREFRLHALHRLAQCMDLIPTIALHRGGDGHWAMMVLAQQIIQALHDDPVFQHGQAERTAMLERIVATLDEMLPPVELASEQIERIERLAAHRIDPPEEATPFEIANSWKTPGKPRTEHDYLGQILAESRLNKITPPKKARPEAFAIHFMDDAA